MNVGRKDICDFRIKGERLLPVDWAVQQKSPVFTKSPGYAIMGAKQAKFVKVHVKKGKPKYRCLECRTDFTKKEVSVCTTCGEDMALETCFLCIGCTEIHPGDHKIVDKVPSTNKNRLLMLRIAEDVHDIEADIGNQLSELKETIWRVEKAHKSRIATVRELLEEAEHEVGKNGAVKAQTRAHLLRAAEEAKIRGRLLLARLKLIDENTQNVLVANGSDLTYEGSVGLRDAMRVEIVKQRRLGNHAAVMEIISELLEATNGKVTLREMHLIARVVFDRLEHISRSTKKMAKVGNGTSTTQMTISPTASPMTLIRTMISGVAGDFRAECAELLDTLTRIHAHADVNIKGHASRDFGTNVEPSVDYLLSLSIEDIAKEQRKGTSMQKFTDLQVVLVRYLLAVHVCATWMSLIESDKDEKSDVRQQLRDCIDGYMYTARGGPFAPGEQVFTTLASALTELAKKHVQVKGVRAVRRRVDKILNSYATWRAQAAIFGTPSSARRAASLRIASNQLWHTINEYDQI
ncbi:unnamed protein product, partial [Mesorhabditis belari]|uniref:Uncharacterized protein n=1 Tax=Mesorhabditis belari TaxID=2138241 RepID=A0AAF3E9V8_9BILA